MNLRARSMNRPLLFAAAAPRKQMAVYAAKHDLGPVEVAADRVAWLARTLTLAP